jgi:hypothetical protein
MPSTSRSWTGWGRRVGWTGHGRAWTRPACAPSVGGPRGRKSGRSWQAWKQARPGLRRRWAAPNRGGHRRQRQRRDDAPGGAGRCAAGADAVRAAAPPARQGPRRQGLRQRSQPRLSAASGDPAADRPAWGGILDAAWAAAVEGGTVAVVVELLAAAGGALGPGLRAVVRVRAGGLRGGLFQPALRKVQDESLARSPGRCHTRKTVPGARRSGWQAGRRGGAACWPPWWPRRPARTIRPYRGEASPGPGPAERTWVRFLLAADDRSGGVERDHPVHL